MIVYLEKTRTFYLQGKHVSYIFAIDAYGHLRHLYFGEQLAVGEDLSFCFRDEDKGFSGNFDGAKDRTASLDTAFLEFPSAGMGDYRRPALLVMTQDGARQTDLRFSSFAVHRKKTPPEGLPYVRGGETLEVVLRDDAYGLKLSLFYTVFDDQDAVVRSAKLVNRSGGDLRVQKISSFSLDFPDASYDTVCLYGRPCSERMPVREACGPGIREFSSALRGSSSHYLNPFFALVRRDTGENAGDAYGFALVYSGAFSLSAEMSSYSTLRVQGGISDYDFSWLLKDGQSFQTPEAALVFSCCGLGGMSRAFHALWREKLLPSRFLGKPRPVVVNSWEAAYFDFNAQKLFSLIDAAAETGADTFVLDDGWFEFRNNDCGGLGDWSADRTKLPGGLEEISAHCRERGLAFGLWFEPEMVSEDSRLYREHPDWCLKNPRRGPVRGRAQLVLDFCNPEVVATVYEKMTRVIESSGATYVKWDMNRYLADLYAPSLPPERQQEVQHRYVLGVYSLAERLTQRFPDLFMEGCSGGGGRFDAGMLFYFPQIWTSDNTDASERAEIQYGTSLCYPPVAMSAHVSACPNHLTGRTTQLASRYSVASLCAFGYELDLCALSREERAALARQVAAYREIEPLVQGGELYRLAQMCRNGLYAAALVSHDKMHAYVAGITGQTNANVLQKRLKICGLDDARRYRVRETGTVASGRALRTMGLLLPPLRSDFMPVELHLEAEPEKA